MVSRILCKVFRGHEWMYLTEERHPATLPGTFKTVVYLYCPSCKVETKVKVNKWERIYRRQEIQSEYDNSFKL